MQMKSLPLDIYRDGVDSQRYIPTQPKINPGVVKQVP